MVLTVGRRDGTTTTAPFFGHGSLLGHRSDAGGGRREVVEGGAEGAAAGEEERRRRAVLQRARVAEAFAELAGLRAVQGREVVLAPGLEEGVFGEGEGHLAVWLRPGEVLHEGCAERVGGIAGGGGGGD